MKAIAGCAKPSQVKSKKSKVKSNAINGDSELVIGMIDISERSFNFSVRIVKLCLYLQEKRRGVRAIANQLLRSGTSIGANIEEARGGQSKADFLAKYQIALKEARETCYWLRLLEDTEVLPNSRLNDILSEAKEIANILAASIIKGRNIKP
jgi:four helix bundle protein